MSVLGQLSDIRHNQRFKRVRWFYLGHFDHLHVLSHWAAPPRYLHIDRLKSKRTGYPVDPRRLLFLFRRSLTNVTLALISRAMQSLIPSETTKVHSGWSFRFCQCKSLSLKREATVDTVATTHSELANYCLQVTLEVTSGHLSMEKNDTCWTNKASKATPVMWGPVILGEYNNTHRYMNDYTWTRCIDTYGL